MKILIAANFDVGLYKFRKELIQKMIDDGHEVYISLPDGDLVKPLVDMGCSFIETKLDRRGMNPVKDFALILSYAGILKKIKPDMVITYTIKPNLYMGMLCGMKRLPYVINITGLGTAFQSHGAVLKLFVNLYKSACKRAQTVIFENSENQQLFKDYGIVKENQCLLNNGAGVNLDEYSFKSYPEEKTIRFLFIGRIMQEKGIDELFAAAEKIKAKYENIEFDILGMYEDDYKSVVEELTKKGVINFYGYQEDVRPFIERAHCFVLPSWHEGMANTNLECAAMGRPVITGNIHGCLEAVVDGETGYLAQPKNADDLYEKLEKFIKLPYDEKVKMGRASHEYVAKVFDKKKVVEKTIERIMN